MNPTAAMLVIGDEILSGRTRDANMYLLAGKLTEIGIDLKEHRTVSDDEDQIVDAIKTLSAKYTHLFTSGGIGPTHDDITADAVAKAFGVPIDVREDARLVLATNYPEGEAALTDARLRMARIPTGATLIDNPISKAPGFTLQNTHVMAGVPKIFEAMLEGLLAGISGGRPLVSETVRIDLPESEIAGPLGKLASENPSISIGSYPFTLNGKYGSNIVVRGEDAAQVSAVAKQVKIAFA